jgi:hypothetical protein
MAASTGPMLATTGISFGNQWLGNDNLDLKILVAGGLATAGLALLERVPGIGAVAPGIAWIAFITLLFTRIGGKPSPIDNLSKLTNL